MLGSILSNLLLVLGCSFFAAGFKFSETQFQVTAAQASASTLTLAVATLIIPAAYHANQKAVAAGGFFNYLAMGEDVGTEVAKKSGLEGLLFISRGTAIVSELSMSGIHSNVCRQMLLLIYGMACLSLLDVNSISDLSYLPLVPAQDPLVPFRSCFGRR